MILVATSYKDTIDYFVAWEMYIRKLHGDL